VVVNSLHRAAVGTKTHTALKREKARPPKRAGHVDGRQRGTFDCMGAERKPSGEKEKRPGSGNRTEAL
jgi:hypothetical protein